MGYHRLGIHAEEFGLVNDRLTDREIPITI